VACKGGGEGDMADSGTNPAFGEKRTHYGPVGQSVKVEVVDRRKKASKTNECGK